MRSTQLSEIQVYTESIRLVTLVYQLIQVQPLNKDYSLMDQIKRAAVSVSANIAEGYGRHTKNDFSHFLSMALGSCNEVRALLDIIHAVYPQIQVDSLIHEYEILCKRIFQFRQKLVF